MWWLELCGMVMIDGDSNRRPAASLYEPCLLNTWWCGLLIAGLGLQTSPKWTRSSLLLIIIIIIQCDYPMALSGGNDIAHPGPRAREGVGGNRPWEILI